MAFVGQNNREQMNVNTSGHQFYNNSGRYQSTLVISYWNEMLSVKFNPILPEDRRSELKMYDYENTVMTTISREIAMGLMHIILNDALGSEEDFMKSIVVGGDSLLFIGRSMSKLGTDNVVIGIHKSLNSHTRKPNMSIMFEFLPLSVIENYDPEDGSGEQIEFKNNNIRLLYNILKSYVMGSSKAFTHADRFVNKRRNDALDSYIGYSFDSSNKSNKPQLSFNKPVSQSVKSDDNVIENEEINNLDSAGF
jgi:hypothetical protein